MKWYKLTRMKIKVEVYNNAVNVEYERTSVDKKEVIKAMNFIFSEVYRSVNYIGSRAE